jgi:hypothetical protein
MKRRNKKEDISRHLLLLQQQKKMTVGYGSDQDRLATALPSERSSIISRIVVVVDPNLVPYLDCRRRLHRCVIP